MAPRTLALALLLPAASLAAGPDLSDLQEEVARLDLAITRYEIFRQRAAGLRHPIPGGPGLTLELPRGRRKLGAIDGAMLTWLPPELLEAARRRIASELDRGYRQWGQVYMPPKRVRAYDPPDRQSSHGWTRAIYVDWDRDVGEPGGLPEASQLLGGLTPAASVDPARQPPPWATLREALQDALETAEAYSPRVLDPRSGAAVWKNPRYWERIQARAWDAASAMVSAMEEERARLVGRFRVALVGLPLPPPPGESSEEAADWDKTFDRRVLPKLPLAMRFALDHRIALAHLRGAWDAKRERHAWWAKAGPEVTRRERQELRAAKSGFDLAGSYHYRTPGQSGREL